MVSARQGPVFARILVVPATRDGLGPFYQDVIAVSPLEPWDAASAAYRLEILARTLPFPVDGARLVPSNNNDVWRLEHGSRGSFPSRRSWTAAEMTGCHGH